MSTSDAKKDVKIYTISAPEGTDYLTLARHRLHVLVAAHRRRHAVVALAQIGDHFAAALVHAHRMIGQAMRELPVADLLRHAAPEAGPHVHQVPALATGRIRLHDAVRVQPAVALVRLVGRPGRSGISGWR